MGENRVLPRKKKIAAGCGRPLCTVLPIVGIATRKVTYDELRLNYRTQCRKAKIIACSIVDRKHTPSLCPAVLLR